MSRCLGPSTLDDPTAKARIYQAVESAEDSPFADDLARAFSADRGDVEGSSKLLIALESMLREEDLAGLRECAREAPLRAFRALWHSGFFQEALEFSSELDLGIRVPSRPSSLAVSGGPHVFAEPEEAGFADARAMSEFGIWGVTEQTLSMMHDVLIKASKPHVLQWDILLTGPAGTEKLEVARALHTLRKRGRFEALDCSEIQSDPSELLDACVAGGTVFLKSLELVSEDWGAALYQAVVPTHVIRSTLGRDRATDITDTQYILDVGERHPHGSVGAFCRQGSWDEVRIPPLSERTRDIPLMVNQALLDQAPLDLSIPSPIDRGRHRLAVAIWEFYEQHEPSGDVAWLRSEIERWVREFSPEVVAAEHVELGSEPQTRNGVEDSHDERENVLRRKANRWTGSFGGSPITVVTRRKGMLAIAYLLDVHTPRGGAREVRMVMEGTGVEGSETMADFGEGGHEFGVQGPQDMTDSQSRQEAEERLIEVEDRLRQLEAKSGLTSSDEEIEVIAEETSDLEEEKKDIRKQLSTTVNLHGRSRTWQPSKDSKIVGNEINRAFGVILKQAEDATDAREEGVLRAFHEHLFQSIKDKNTDSVRYDSSLQWRVEV